MSRMKGSTAVAVGFMNKDISLTSVLRLTVDFLGRKLTGNELNNIIRAYNKQQEFFYV